jgi:hypothetical protein
MSFASRIVRKVTGSLKLSSPPTKLNGKLRDTNIADLRDPRFTRDQFEKLKAKSTGTEHSAGHTAGEPRFRR